MPLGEQGVLKSRPAATNYVFDHTHKDLSSMELLSLKEVSAKQNFIPDSPGETRKFCKYNMLGLITMFINNR